MKIRKNNKVPDLPQESQLNVNEPNYENNVMKVIRVLRSTQEEVGEKLRNERIKKKIDKKLDNIEFLRHTIVRNRQTLKNKIKKMRKDKIFPLPKSYTNYKNRNGLLKKNSIKINK